MKPRFIVMITVFLLIYTVLNAYVGFHGMLFFTHLFGDALKVGYWICYWLIVYAYILARVVQRFVPTIVSSALKVIGSYWMAIMSYGVLLLPFIDLIAGVLHLN